MPWIRSETSAVRNHKILRLALALKIEPVQVLGHLHMFWHNVLELREDGDITVWSNKEIANYAGYGGDPDKFVESLMDGFIDKTNGNRLIHDWLDYAGPYLHRKYGSKKDQYEEIQNKYISPKATPKAALDNGDNGDNGDNNTMSGKPDLIAPILYLNKKAKRNYDPKNKANQDLVKARYAEGRSIKDFYTVIDKKVATWLTDEKMAQYLRPSTLFNRTKFENYLNEPECPSDKPSYIRG